MAKMLALFLAFLVSGGMQNPGPSVTGARASAVTNPYTFSQYAYYVLSASSLASITSNSVTVSAGDFAFQACRGASSPTSVAGSSAPASTVNALPIQYFSSGANASYLNTFWYPSLSAGATTFTCTPSASELYQSMTVIIYHHSGTPAILSASTTHGSCTAVTSCTSTAFSTASTALVIDCASEDGTSTWTAGLIGGSGSNLRGVDNTPVTSSSAALGCEDIFFSSAQSSITAAIGTAVSGDFGYTVAAFN